MLPRRQAYTKRERTCLWKLSIQMHFRDDNFNCSANGLFSLRENGSADDFLLGVHLARQVLLANPRPVKTK